MKRRATCSGMWTAAGTGLRYFTLGISMLQPSKLDTACILVISYKCRVAMYVTYFLYLTWNFGNPDVSWGFKAEMRTCLSWRLWFQVHFTENWFFSEGHSERTRAEVTSYSKRNASYISGENKLTVGVIWCWKRDPEGLWRTLEILKTWLDAALINLLWTWIGLETSRGNQSGYMIQNSSQ